METSRTLLALGVTIALLGGCKKQEDAAPAAAEPVAAATAEPAAPAPAAAEPAAPAAAAPGARFDLAAIPVSTAALPAWPNLAPPAGYEFDDADRLAAPARATVRRPADQFARSTARPLAARCGSGLGDLVQVVQIELAGSALGQDLARDDLLARKKVLHGTEHDLGI